MKLLKVSSSSVPNSVAGAIAGVVRAEGKVQIQTIGAGALNQSIKGIAIARGYIAPTGQELVCIPFFKDIEVNGEIKTAIVLTVEVK
jgi:stage V sporulation protein S